MKSSLFNILLQASSCFQCFLLQQKQLHPTSPICKALSSCRHGGQVVIFVQVADVSMYMMLAQQHAHTHIMPLIIVVE